VNEIERYEFDRVGYLLIGQLLRPDEVATLSAAVDELEEHAARRVKLPPRKRSVWGAEYHRDEERHYHAWGEQGKGKALVIEDFWNASSAFDLLLDHAGTLEYITQAIVGRHTINNSEIRIRYPGNKTGTHMGGPIDHKYRYAFTRERIDCMMVRMIYFLHDVADDEGPFCVVPGTHKSNYSSPYGNDPDVEPGMVGLPVRAGDAILFTENLRHGGLTNRSNRARKTVHVGYGPHWVMSQNAATVDEPPYIHEATRRRLTVAQGDLFRAWPDAPLPFKA
jgi:phytanoyl-CoA dioxygenase PhyH